MPTRLEKAIGHKKENLSKALNILMHDITHANIYNDLLNKLFECRRSKTEIFKQSNTFWYLTFESIKESMMIRLCRVTDTEKKSISIGNLLQAIKGCKSLFSNEQFINENRDNPFIAFLSEYNRDIDDVEIDKEIKTYNSNPTVKKIRKLRNNIIAHKGITEGLRNFEIVQENMLSYDEVLQFLNSAHNMIDKYVHKLTAVSWTNNIVGQNDYIHLIEMASKGLTEHRRAWRISEQCND